MSSRTAENDFVSSTADGGRSKYDDDDDDDDDDDNDIDDNDDVNCESEVSDSYEEDASLG